MSNKNVQYSTNIGEYFKPDERTDKRLIESFKGPLRDECLNTRRFEPQRCAADLAGLERPVHRESMPYRP